MNRTSPQLTVDYEARLAGADDPLKRLIRQQLTLENPKYRDARKYSRWIGKELKPQLHFFREEGGELIFPRGFANQAVLFCRQMGAGEPAIIDRRTLAAPVSLSFQGELRPYQQKALTAILARDFGVLEAGTGSGKTVIALAALAARRQPALILVHTKELLHQWAARIEEFLGIEAGLIGDGHYQLRPLTVAIVNSARRRLAELPDHFGQICVDECHRVPAALFTEVVTAFACRYMLGLSATAFRRDGLTRLIHLYLGDPVHKVCDRDLQQSGAVLKAELMPRPTEFRYVYRGNYQALMKALTADPARNRQIVADIVREATVADTAGTLLVVSDRVQHCEQLARLLAEQEVACEVLTGATPAERRQAVVEAIRAGELKVVISTIQLIGEGFDCPGLHTLFLTTPIKFSGRLLQVVGRILRPAAGKQPRVYDYVDPVGALRAAAQTRAQTLQM